MNAHGWFVGGIEGNSAHLANFGQRQDVCNGGRVIPNATQVVESTDHVRVLVAAVGKGTEGVFAFLYIAEHGCVVENRNRRLRIKKNPCWVDARAVGLSHHVCELCKRGAGRRKCPIGAVRGIVSDAVAVVTLDFVVSQAVAPRDSAALGESDATTRADGGDAGGDGGALVGAPWSWQVFWTAIVHEEVIGACHIAWVLIISSCVLIG